MKVFQTLQKYAPYIPHFEQKYKVDDLSFAEHVRLLLKDRFHALHLLQPILTNTDNGFYTIWNYEALQLKWAREQGWNETDLKKILYAQIETFQPDVFYNLSALAFTKEELTTCFSPTLKKICWSASPFYDNEILGAYDTRLTNLITDVKSVEEVGFRSDLFQPAYEDKMASFAANTDRPIDLLFYGQYADDSFKKRNAHIDSLLEFKQQHPELTIQLHLQYRTRTESIINIPYVRRYLRKVVFPSALVRTIAEAPTYGLDLYDKIGKSKIVFNAGVDFSKAHKVNMRNFEVLGCGAHMISDEGIYPKGFEMGKHFSTYKNTEECLEKIKHLLQEEEYRRNIAEEGHVFVKKEYTKEKQWNTFQQIVGSL